MRDNSESIGDKSKRLNRRFLLLIGSVVGGSWIAGCMKLLVDSENESDDSSNGDSNDSSQGQESSPNTTTTNQTEDGSENSSDSENESGDERQRAPTEEDTEINRSQYNETEPRDVEDRPESDVTVETEHHISSDGSVTVRGEITNTSSEPIDFVDIEITYLNEAGEPIGMTLETVWNLKSGSDESQSFIISANPVDLRGDVDDIKTTAYPQDYVESD